MSRQQMLAWWFGAKAVLWGFLGVRRRQEWQSDVRQVHPMHVLVAGLVLVLGFVGGLVLLVKWVVH